VSPAAGRRGIPFLLAAPSGTGKTSVCHLLIEKNRKRGDPPIVFSVSHTTRRRREEEREGVDYYFVSPQEFQRLEEGGTFLESADYDGNRYGTSRSSVEDPIAEGKDVLLEIEIEGARQVRRRREDVRFLFLLPPSMEELRRRLEARGTDTPEQIARRLERAWDELVAAEDFDYAVVNDELDDCVESVLEIIGGERSGEPAALRRRFSPRPALAEFRRRSGP
jgi:guanylate kinase